jgi:hypothetical protein
MIVRVALVRSVAAAAALCSTSLAVAAAAGVPVYPGAVNKPVSAAVNSQEICGHKIKIDSYDSTGDPRTIAAWYKSHVSGAITIDSSSNDGNTRNTTLSIYSGAGDAVVVVMRMDFSNPKLQASASTIGMDKTSIGIEHIAPPFGSDYLAAVQLATSKDAGAVKAARAKLAAECPNG